MTGEEIDGIPFVGHPRWCHVLHVCHQVHADEEIVHGARFTDLFGTTESGVVTVDLARLSEFDRVPLPPVEYTPSTLSTRT